VIFIYNNKGNTLPEILLAFSIYIVCVVMFVSLLNVVLVKQREIHHKYRISVVEQNEKELTLWR